MDFHNLKIRSDSYLNANKFYKDNNISPIPTSVKIPTSILNTSVYIYDNSAIIIQPKSLKVTKEIHQILAKQNILAFVFSKNIILHHLAKKYPIIAPNIIFLSKSPNIAIPILNHALNIFTPPQLKKYKSQTIAKYKKKYTFY